MKRESVSDEEPNYGLRQREVQRWMGRCLLSLQQYERLLKAYLHAHEVSAQARVGTDQPLVWQEQRRFPADNVRNQSLGQLVNKLFDGVVTEVSGKDAVVQAPEPDGADFPADILSFRHRFTLELTSEVFPHIKEGIETLVRERNEMVHHFIDRFDLWTLEGCDQAVVYLQDWYRRIEQQCTQLRDWAAQMNKSREYAAQMASQHAWQELVFSTDQEKDPHKWALLLAELNCLPDAEGWVLLDAALLNIQRQSIKCSPGTIKLKTWHQVLKHLPDFEVERRPDGQGANKVWYRFHIGAQTAR